MAKFRVEYSYSVPRFDDFEIEAESIDQVEDKALAFLRNEEPACAYEIAMIEEVRV